MGVPITVEARGGREHTVHLVESYETIASVMGRYHGRVPAWDVVDDAIDEGALRDPIWSRVIGPEYVDPKPSYRVLQAALVSGTD